MREPCKRCGVIHTCEPADPKKILAKMAEEIAKDIDRELLAEMLKNSRLPDKKELL